MNKDIKRTALVTGGSSGIGQATVIALAKQNHEVIFTYRSKAGAEKTLLQADALGLKVSSVFCDLSDTEASRKLVNNIYKRYGHLDILVNCAGISNTKTIEEIDENEWDRMLNINLRATFFISQAAYIKMKHQKYGCIITLTSIAGQRGGFFSGVHYSASKGGLEAMMKSFALRGAEYNITSNAVSPGVVKTPMSEAEGIPADGIPLGRAAEPEELANTIVFLASDKARYITGLTMDVNGGQLMR